MHVWNNVYSLYIPMKTRIWSTFLLTKVSNISHYLCIAFISYQILRYLLWYDPKNIGTNIANVVDIFDISSVANMICLLLFISLGQYWCWFWDSELVNKASTKTPNTLKQNQAANNQSQHFPSCSRGYNVSHVAKSIVRLMVTFNLISIFLLFWFPCIFIFFIWLAKQK